MDAKDWQDQWIEWLVNFHKKETFVPPKQKKDIVQDGLQGAMAGLGKSRVVDDGEKLDLDAVDWKDQWIDWLCNFHKKAPLVPPKQKETVSHIREGGVGGLGKKKSCLWG